MFPQGTRFEVRTLIFCLCYRGDLPVRVVCLWGISKTRCVLRGPISRPPTCDEPTRTVLGRARARAVVEGYIQCALPSAPARPRPPARPMCHTCHVSLPRGLCACARATRAMCMLHPQDFLRGATLLQTTSPPDLRSPRRRFTRTGRTQPRLGSQRVGQGLVKARPCKHCWPAAQVGWVLLCGPKQGSPHPCQEASGLQVLLTPPACGPPLFDDLPVAMQPMPLLDAVELVAHEVRALLLRVRVRVRARVTVRVRARVRVRVRVRVR